MGYATDEACDLPYLWYGDLRACRLPLNHDADCADAHRAHEVFLDSLEARTRAAQTNAGRSQWL